MQEDDKIAHLVGKLGAKRWSLIAQELPGRIGKQCRERYLPAPLPPSITGQYNACKASSAHVIGLRCCQNYLH